jgi:ActR/RegA family two-component response regulator
VESKLLLAIDDDDTDRKRIIRWLGRRFPVCEASTARVGIDMARRLRPGCVLLDYHLTDACGLEVLEELVKGDFSVVVLTGRGSEATAVRALKAGAVDYLVKDTLTEHELGDAVARALERTRRRLRGDVTCPELGGFEELVGALLGPGLARIRAACMVALEARPDLAEVLGGAIDELRELDEHVRGLLELAGVDGLCAETGDVDLAVVGRRVAGRLADDGEGEMVLGDMPIVRGAAAALEVLLLELARAGLRHAANARERSVRVRAGLRGNAWEVRVEDDGPSPAPPELSREIFRPYRRGTARDRAFALAAEVVRRHAGEIWIEPAQPHGCHAVFRLPLAR